LASAAKLLAVGKTILAIGKMILTSVNIPGAPGKEPVRNAHRNLASDMLFRSFLSKRKTIACDTLRKDKMVGSTRGTLSSCDR